MASSAYPHMIFATDKAELDRDRLVALLGECCPGGEAEQSSLKVTWTREGYAFTFWFEDADRVGEMYADYLPDGARRRPLVNATTVIDMSGAADPDGTHEGVARVIARHLAQQDGVSVFGEERKRFVGMAYGDETPEELAALAEPVVVSAPAEDAAPPEDVSGTGDVAHIEPPTAPEAGAATAQAGETAPRPAEATAADEAVLQPGETTPHAEEYAAAESAAPRTEGAAPQTAAAGPAQVEEAVAADPGPAQLRETAADAAEESLETEPALSGDTEPGAFGAELVESSLTDQGDQAQVDRPQGEPADESPARPEPDTAQVTRTPGTPPQAEGTPTPTGPTHRVPGTAPVHTGSPASEGDRTPESPSAETELVAPHPPTDAQPTTEVPGGALDEQRVDARPQDVEPAVTSAGEGAFGADLPREQAPQPAAEPRPAPEPQPAAEPKQEKGFFKKLFGRR